MDLDRFTRNLDTFGADFRRWPERERAAAEPLRDSSEEARRRWQQASRLDRLFALDRAAETDEGQISLTDTAITDAALRRIRNQRRPAFEWRWLLAQPMRAAFGATLAAGLVAGFLAGPLLPPSQPPGIHALSALLDGGGELEELF